MGTMCAQSSCGKKYISWKALKEMNARGVYTPEQIQEQVDKALEVIDSLPNLEKIVYFETKGMYSYDHPKLMKFDEFLKIGEEEFNRDSNYVELMLNKIEDDDVAFLVYT